MNWGLAYLLSAAADGVATAGLTCIPIAVTGSWVKDGHRFSITREDLDDIVSNFAKRGTGDVVVDYEHASERPSVANGGPVPASGWIKGLSVADGADGGHVLMAQIEWTPKALDHIKSQEYKYFSPAIDWGAANKKTGKSVGAKLTSGALTNHPFLEELPALTLSDIELADGVGKQVVVPLAPNTKIKVKVEPKDGGGDGTSLHEMADGATTKSEGDGDHPASHYLVVEDPKHPTTWHLRVKDTDGKPDHTLMGAAWAALHDGYRGNKYTGPDKGEAIRKLNALYKSEGMDNPDEQKASSVRLADDMSHEEQRTALSKAIQAKFGAGVNSLPGCCWDSYPWVRDVFDDYCIVETGGKMFKFPYTIDAKGNVELEDPVQVKQQYVNASEVPMPKTVKLNALSKAQLDDIDALGVDGDRGMQETLRKQAESRASKVDKPSDGDETEELSEKDDAEKAAKLPRFAIRNMRSSDKVGKMAHHAVIAPDGSMAGYITHGDMKKHMNSMAGAEAGRSEGTMRASETAEAELERATGRKMTLSEAGDYITRGIAAQAREASAGSVKLLLSEAVTDNAVDNRRVRRLLADGKITMSQFADFEDAVEDVNAAIGDGRFVPAQRGALIQLCMSDRDAFRLLAQNQPRSNRGELVGFPGKGNETHDNPDAIVEAGVKQLMSDNKDMSYGTAMTKYLNDHPVEAENYHKAHRRQMA